MCFTLSHSSFCNHFFFLHHILFLYLHPPPPLSLSLSPFPLSLSLSLSLSLFLFLLWCFFHIFPHYMYYAISNLLPKSFATHVSLQSTFGVSFLWFCLTKFHNLTLIIRLQSNDHTTQNSQFECKIFVHFRDVYKYLVKGQRFFRTFDDYILTSTHVHSHTVGLQWHKDVNSYILPWTILWWSKCSEKCRLSRNTRT